MGVVRLKRPRSRGTSKVNGGGKSLDVDGEGSGGLEN